MVGGFQNCAKTNFGSPPGSMLDASVNGDGSGDATGNLVQNGDTCTVADGSGTDDTSTDTKSASCKNNMVPGMPNQAPKNQCEEDAPSDLVACILNGPGKSVKLGLVSGALAGVNGVSSSVCISKSECLGDVAKSFGVTGAYVRGYCGNNPNVQSLSDAQVKTLLGI